MLSTAKFAEVDLVTSYHICFLCAVLVLVMATFLCHIHFWTLKALSPGTASGILNYNVHVPCSLLSMWLCVEMPL